MECQHTVTRTREGPSRDSWCIACGVRVMAVHDRPCRECVSYEPRDTGGGESRIGICKHKDHGPMYVTSDMHVTYYVDPGLYRYGLCFETKPA